MRCVCEGSACDRRGCTFANGVSLNDVFETKSADYSNWSEVFPPKFWDEIDSFKRVEPNVGSPTLDADEDESRPVSFRK